MSGGGGSFNPVQAATVPFTGGASLLSGGPGQVSQLGGGFMSDIMGQSRLADVQGQIGEAQLAQQGADRQLAMQLMAPTDAEIQQLQQAMAVNQQAISQGQALINSADPALVAAGQQALDLMNGKSAAALAPMNNQRAQQREQLKSQLEQQLGPGYATSSAGIQALNSFDQQTANLTATTQQNAINQFMGYGIAGRQLGMGQQQQGFQNMLAGNSQRYGWQQGQAGALMGTPVNPGLAYQGQLAQAGYNAGNMQALAGGLYQNRGNFSGMFPGGASGGGGGGAGAYGGSAGAGAMGGDVALGSGANAGVTSMLGGAMLA